MYLSVPSELTIEYMQVDLREVIEEINYGTESLRNIDEEDMYTPFADIDIEYAEEIEDEELEEI